MVPGHQKQHKRKIPQSAFSFPNIFFSPLQSILHLHHPLPCSSSSVSILLNKKAEKKNVTVIERTDIQNTHKHQNYNFFPKTVCESK